MSLINEALKKAEHQRRLGEPPSFGTPFSRPPRRRSVLPYLAVAIVAAAAAGFYLSRPDTSDDVTAAKPGTGKAAPADAGPATTIAAATPPAVTATNSTDQHPAGTVPGAISNPGTGSALNAAPQLKHQVPPAMPQVAERESEPLPPSANPLAPGEPRPETGPNDATGLAARQAAKETTVVTSATPAGSEAGHSPFIKERTAVPAPPAPSAKLPGSSPAPAPDLAMPEQKIPPPVARAAAEQAPPAAALEQLPAYWQLPYNVRKELPELKMSMHVYSATPTQRFVVLNGNRQVEGDEIGGEVHVAEIRTDGVVLSYHGQRFLVPRGGS
ncbi:MAG: general secretion pathway protein GspB [Rhodanobacteraceae bacterium]|nr:general secretion pathway protein GspB [Rhodanobacteraceae bacterium]